MASLVTTTVTGTITVSSDGSFGGANETSATLFVRGGNADFWNSTNSLLRINHDGTRANLQCFTGGAYDDLALNPDGGSVGIGTAGPDSKLEIAGGSYNSSLKIKGSGGDTGIQFEDSGGTTDGYIYADGGSIGFLDSGASWAIQCKNDDFIRFSITSNTEHMRINSDGEVGIGTNDPTQQLMVWEGSSSVSFGEWTNGAVIWLDGVNGDISGGDYYHILADDSTALRFGYGATHKVSMLGANGYVGIGTTNPAARLHVDGTVRVGVDAAGHDVMIYGATTSRYLEWDASMDLVRMRDNVKAVFGNGDDLQIYHDGSHSYIDANNAGDLYVRSLNDDVVIVGADDVFIYTQGGEEAITARGNGKVELFYDGSSKFETTSLGVEATLYGFDKGGSSIGGYLELTNQAGDASSNDVTVTAAHSTNSVVLRAAQKVEFYTYASSAYQLRMTILNNGKVGIGTTDPAVNLEVSGTNPAFDLAQAGTSIFRTELDGANDVYQTVYGAGNQWILRTNGGTAALTINASQSASFAGAITAPSITLSSFLNVTGTGGSATFSGDMTIAGKLLIGTATTAGGKLMVSNSDNTVYDASQASHQRDEGSTLMINNESTTAGSFSQILLRNRSSNVGGCRIVSIDSGADDSELAIVTGDTGESMRILGDGKVGIGTTNPAKLLELYSTSHVEMILNTTSNTSNCGIDFDLSGTRKGIIRYDHNATDASAKFEFYAGGDTSTPKMVLMGSGSVGIGTATPGSNTPLHIYTNSASDQTILLDNDSSGRSGLKLRTDLNSDGNSTGFIIFDALNDASQDTRYATIESFIVDNSDGTEDGSLRFSVMAGGNDVESMTIAAKSGTSDIGWVGVGTKAPHFPLQVLGVSQTNGDAKRVVCILDSTSAAAGTGAGIALGGYTNGTASAINDFGVIQGIKENATAGNYASAMLFSTRANGGNPTEQMRINSSGNVGINTNNPAQMLSVFQGKIGVTDAYMIGNLDGNTGMLTYSSNRVTWEIGGSEKMRLNSSGSVGIGTTNPFQKLDVQGIGFFSTAGNTQVNNYYASLIINNTGTGTWSRLRFDRSGVERWGIGLGTDDKLRISNLFTGGSAASPNDSCFVIDNNGQIGINVDPDGGLKIKSRADGENVLNMVDSAGDAMFNIRQSSNDCLIRAYKDGGSQKVQIHTDGDSYFVGGSVGIGTISPGTQLDVNQTAGDNTYPLKIRGNIDNDGGFTGITFGYEGDTRNYEKARIMVEGTSGNVQPNMHFLLNSGANNSSAVKADARLSILNDGNVGIGVNAPTSRLHVTGDTGNSNFLAYIYNSGTQTEDNGLNVQIASSGSSAMGLRVNTGGDSNALVVAGDGDTGLGFTPSNFYHKFNVNGGAYINGSVGIGTTDPGAALDVAKASGTVLRCKGDSFNTRFAVGASGACTIEANTGSYPLHITNADSGNKGLKIEGTSYFSDAAEFDGGIKDKDGSLGTNTHVLHTNGSDVYWAAASGGGGSGTVTSVATSTGLTGGTITTSGTLSVTTGVCMGIYKGSAGGSVTPSSRYFTFSEGTGISMSFSGSTITFSSGTSSDYRLKKNISSFNSGAWTKVKSVNLRKFDFDEDAFRIAIDSPDQEIVGIPKSYTDNVGFIAHELAGAGIDGAVIGEKDAVDSDGNLLYQKVNYNALVPVLWGALNEAISKIEILESKVQALEDK